MSFKGYNYLLLEKFVWIFYINLFSDSADSNVVKYLTFKMVKYHKSEVKKILHLLPLKRNIHTQLHSFISVIKFLFLIKKLVHVPHQQLKLPHEWNIFIICVQ